MGLLGAAASAGGDAGSANSPAVFGSSVIPEAGSASMTASRQIIDARETANANSRLIHKDTVQTSVTENQALYRNEDAPVGLGVDSIRFYETVNQVTQPAIPAVTTDDPFKKF